jgi:hypothetical protein
MDLYIHSPIRLHGVVLISLSTGTTLPSLLHCHLKSHMESSFHSLTPFLPLFCNCKFRRLDSIQILQSQAHIAADWHPETRLFTSQLLLYIAEHLFITSCTEHAENTASIIKEACLPSRCLAMGPYVTIRYDTDLVTMNMWLFSDSPVSKLYSGEW